VRRALQMKTMDQSLICYCYADADKIVLSGHRSESKVRGKIPNSEVFFPNPKQKGK